MYEPGQRVVIRDSNGNDIDTNAMVEEVRETVESQLVRVKLSNGRVVDLPRNQVVENLED